MTTSCLIMVFVTTMRFIQAFTTNSGLIQVFATIHTQFRFLRQLHIAKGTQPDSFMHSQLNALCRFSSQLDTQIDLISLCEHHSHIIKSCLVMVIGHSNSEKGYKVYNISDKLMIITNGEPV